MATAVAAYLARKTEKKMLAHAAPQLPGAGLAHAVAHQVHGASLPGRPLEDLAYGPDQAPVGIGYDELGAGRAVQNHGKLHFHRVFLH